MLNEIRENKSNPRRRKNKSLVKKSTKAHSAQATFYQALRFFQAAQIILIEFEKRFINDASALHIYIPYIVNLAFSCELYLKCAIHCENGEEASGHELFELFNLLHEPTKVEIITAALAEPQLLKETFNEELSSTSNTFYRWRYLNEDLGDGTGNPRLMTLIASNLHRMISARYPDWEPFYQSGVKDFR